MRRLSTISARHGLHHPGWVHAGPGRGIVGWVAVVWLCVLGSLVRGQGVAEAGAASIDLVSQDLPGFPEAAGSPAIGAVGSWVILIDPGSGGLFGWKQGEATWREIGGLSLDADEGGNGGVSVVGGGDACYVITRGGRVASLSVADGELVSEWVSDVPTGPAVSGFGSFGGLLHALRADGLFRLSEDGQAWARLGDAPDVAGPCLLAEASGRLFVLARGGEGTGSEMWRWRGGRWVRLAEPPRGFGEEWETGAGLSAVPVGPSHLFVFAPKRGAGGSLRALVYHAITDSWSVMSGVLPGAGLGVRDETVRVVPAAGAMVVVGEHGATLARLRPVTPRFPLLDYIVVGAYLVGMVVMGALLMRREKSSDDYFRGGRRIPWWATGVSLFATGASAITLMSMPAQSYAVDWGYFSLSIFSIMALPISIFLVAPIVRRLNISTANEYLERRFGVTTRLFASVIYIVTQVAGRMATVMLLPALALNAITGTPVWVSILIMGGITTAYTFLGGLKAVIWTDTVQGLVMCLSIAGCLALVMVKLGMGPGEIAAQAVDLNKINMFDFSPSLYKATAWCFLIQSVVFTFGYIADQNYVQRIQAVPTLRDAQKAISTQLAVAVPINILVFALGTALWFFYRSHPQDLNPLMETDGIYPFFVAQQLPQGVSGLVVASLLAATMSTISSSICSVSDLGVNDFYKRFAPGATDREALAVGYVLMLLTGVVGTGIALVLSVLDSRSVWDLALMLTGLITNSIIGLFWLGLISRRVNEAGAISGVVAGFVCVVLCKRYTGLSFLLYQAIGSVVAMGVGYAVSLVLPRGTRDVSGLTLQTMGLGGSGRAHDGDQPGGDQV